ncbi:MAG: APC family permease [Parachlamydiales bacterium]|nr:APC family permease [Parachlamydiales bacterium]
MSLKNFLIGSPLHTVQEKKERFTKLVGLAILSSDALSSVAYATEEILMSLMVGGIALTHFSLPISLCISLLIVIVAISYYQTLIRYPQGGGAYSVSKANLGRNTSLVAGASLLIDYTLTVTVSVTAGVAALTSAIPFLFHHRILLCVLCTLILTIANLRGIRESGRLFCFPVYLFIVTVAITIGLGLYYSFFTPEAEPSTKSVLTSNWPLWILLRAFASGCVALTGIEAIANGVQSFKPPEARNAGITLIWMATLLGVLFIGITYVAKHLGIIPVLHETVLSQVVAKTFGRGIMYYIIQAATCLILLLAANTAFAGFPKLTSIIAYDSYLPKQLTSRGDRLVFSNGIIILALFALILIFIFNGYTSPLIPLYTVGVFTAFTLSQAGMVKNWITTKTHGWMRGVFINGIGALTTGVVLCIVAVTKFIHGAWIVLLAAPLIVYLMRKIHSYYSRVQNQIALKNGDTIPHYTKNRALVPISGVIKTSMNAIAYAQLITKNIDALYIALDPNDGKKIQKEWAIWHPEIPLKILESPTRSLIQPLLKYIEDIQDQEEMITVIIPALVPTRWWHQLLHNQISILLRMLLLFKPKVVTITVPLRIEE